MDQEALEETLDLTLEALEITLEEQPEATMALDPQVLDLCESGREWEPEDWAALKQTITDRWGMPLDHIDDAPASATPLQLASCDEIALYKQLDESGKPWYFLGKTGYWPKP